MARVRRMDAAAGLSGGLPRLATNPAFDAEVLRAGDLSQPTARTRRRRSLVRRSLLVADLISLVTVLLLVEAYAVGTAGVTGATKVGVYMSILVIVIGTMGMYGLYGRDETRADHTTVDDLSAVFHAITVCAVAAAGISSLAGDAASVVPAVCVGWLGAVFLVPVGRGLARTVARRRNEYVQNVLVVGAGQIGQLMARKLLNHPEYRLNVVGFVDDEPLARADDVSEVPVLGGTADLPVIARQYDVERVIVAFTNTSHTEQLRRVRAAQQMDLQVDIVPRLFETVGPNVDINVFEGLVVMALPQARLSRPNLVAKRALDIVVSASALIALFPFLIAIAVAIQLESGPGALFRGRRIGRGGRHFDQLKFRTMHQVSPAAFQALLDANPSMKRQFAETQKLVADPRVTRVGRLLRRLSLDELPQLWNVLRGDLSLVGPRPITDAERLERYEPVLGTTSAEPTIGYWDVEALRPGLTGYWQINGRSSMSFDERQRLDTAYLTSWSLKLDLAILARTLRALVAGRGAY